MINLKDLLELIPVIYDYFVPGFVFFWLRKVLFQANKDERTLQNYVVFSTIIKTIVDAFIVFVHFEETPIELVRFYYILISAGVFAANYLIVKLPAVNEYLIKKHGISFEEDIWARTIDKDERTSICLTLSNGKVVAGSPAFINDKYIAVVNYYLGNNKKNDDYEFGDIYDDSQMCVVPIAEVKMMQTDYADGSKVKQRNQKVSI